MELKHVDMKIDTNWWSDEASVKSLIQSFSPPLLALKNFFLLFKYFFRKQFFFVECKKRHNQKIISQKLMILIPVKSPKVPPKNKYKNQEKAFCVKLVNLPRLAICPVKVTRLLRLIEVTVFDAKMTLTIAILCKVLLQNSSFDIFVPKTISS